MFTQKQMTALNNAVRSLKSRSEIVRRKKSWPLSTKAMTLADLTMDLEAINELLDIGRKDNELPKS